METIQPSGLGGGAALSMGGLSGSGISPFDTTPMDSYQLLIGYNSAPARPIPIRCQLAFQKLSTLYGNWRKCLPACINKRMASVGRSIAVVIHRVFSRKRNRSRQLTISTSHVVRSCDAEEISYSMMNSNNRCIAVDDKIYNSINCLSKLSHLMCAMAANREIKNRQR